MKRKSTAFRCHHADVRWQALPSPVQENTEKSALLSCLSQPWRTAEADWQDLEQRRGSAAKTQTGATCRFLWASGGSSHSSRPRWVTRSASTRCTLCIYVRVHTCPPFRLCLESTFFHEHLLTLQARWKRAYVCAPCWFAGVGQSSQGAAFCTQIGAAMWTGVFGRSYYSDTLGRLWTREQPWIFPQANGGAGINIHWVSCDLQRERPSQLSLGEPTVSPIDKLAVCISPPSIL